MLANIDARKEAEKVLHNNGVIVIFPSGQIATKDNLKLKTKAHDGDWKQFVSKLIVKTKSPVLPSYFEGQNSQLYHIANKMGQTFRYSLLMHELTRKIGDTINLHFGKVIPFSDFEKIGNLIEITKYIRMKTYSLDPKPVHNSQ
jgi:putative hemolysin